MKKWSHLIDEDANIDEAIDWRIAASLGAAVLAGGVSAYRSIKKALRQRRAARAYREYRSQAGRSPAWISPEVRRILNQIEGGQSSPSWRARRMADLYVILRGWDMDEGPEKDHRQNTWSIERTLMTVFGVIAMQELDEPKKVTVPVTEYPTGTGKRPTEMRAREAEEEAREQAAEEARLLKASNLRQDLAAVNQSLELARSSGSALDAARHIDLLNRQKKDIERKLDILLKTQKAVRRLRATRQKERERYSDILSKRPVEVGEPDPTSPSRIPAWAAGRGGREISAISELELPPIRPMVRPFVEALRRFAKTDSEVAEVGTVRALLNRGQIAR